VSELEPTIRVESTRVKFETSDGKIISLPASHGTFHDPSGKEIAKCTVYFGPWKRTSRRVQMNQSNRRYFGTDYQGKLAILPDIPREGWEQVAKVVKIFYVRRGTRAPGGFHHPFKGKPLTLSKNGSLYKLSCGSGCLIDDRGYVWP